MRGVVPGRDSVPDRPTGHRWPPSGHCPWCGENGDSRYVMGDRPNAQAFCSECGPAFDAMRGVTPGDTRYRFGYLPNPPLTFMVSSHPDACPGCGAPGGRVSTNLHEFCACCNAHFRAVTNGGGRYLAANGRTYWTTGETPS